MTENTPPSQTERSLHLALEDAIGRWQGNEQDGLALLNRASQIVKGLEQRNAELESALAAAVAQERERCAIIAWSTGMDRHNKKLGLPDDCREVGSACAAAIRAAKEKP